jgi:hypothetical protein
MSFHVAPWRRVSRNHFGIIFWLISGPVLNKRLVRPFRRLLFRTCFIEQGLLVACEFFARKHYDGHVAQAGICLHLVEQLESAHVGQAQVEHHAIKRAFAHRGECRLATIDRNGLDVLVIQQLDDRRALDGVVLDHQQPFRMRGCEILDAFERHLEAGRSGSLTT